MATAQDLIEAALKEIGVLAASETLSSGEAVDALARLNRWIDSQAAQNLVIYGVTRSTQAITPSQASYTVGSGGNINITRPVFIERVNFMDTSVSPSIEYPLGDLLTEEDWTEITMKGLTAPFPRGVYYSPTYPLGTLTPWPIPTANNLQWVVYHWAAISQFSTLATTVSLPPAYEEMIVQNLALLLCPSYERQPHPVLVKSAADAMATVKRANHRVQDLSFGADVQGDRGYGNWNIRTGP